MASTVSNIEPPAKRVSSLGASIVVVSHTTIKCYQECCCFIFSCHPADAATAFCPPPIAAVSSAKTVAKPPLKSARVSSLGPTTTTVVCPGAGICLFSEQGHREEEGKSQGKVSRSRAPKRRQGGDCAGIKVSPHTQQTQGNTPVYVLEPEIASWWR
jgi:hypothetical protein